MWALWLVLGAGLGASVTLLFGHRIAEASGAAYSEGLVSALMYDIETRENWKEESVSVTTKEALDEVMQATLWHYRATVDRVVDGDTVDVTIDQGFRDFKHKQRIRLYGINAPELRRGSPEEREAGQAATDWLRDKIEGREVILKTYKDRTGKWGRWLGTLFLNGVDINQQLIEEGHAVASEE